VDEPLGLLLLPSALEEFELAEHARGLLQIPRVVALEPGRVHTPSFMRDAAAVRQAKRLKLPGAPRLVVLYHPIQYPLARALLAHDEKLELWYVPLPDASDAADSTELVELDQLARAHSTQIVPVRAGPEVDDAPLRERMRELDVINARAFVPVARSRRRR